MTLDEQAQDLEQRTLKHARQVPCSASLREILKEALESFNKLLNQLPPSEREEALASYLNKVRKVSFGFHLALIKRDASERYLETTDRETQGNILRGQAEEMQRIGRLYRFL